MKTYLIILFSLVVVSSFAHGDLDVRIQTTTDAILLEPDNDSLYLSRGTLYYQHEDFMKSIRDFEKVESLAGPSSVVYMSYAKSWYKLSKYEFSLDNIDLALTLNPKNAVAYRLKGEVLLSMGEFDRASENYALSLEYTEKLITESFIELAIALDSVNTKESILKSINVLNDGRKRLADLSLFKTMIVDQYIKLNKLNDAIQMQSLLIEGANRKERHYFKRAKLYVKANDLSQAKADIQKAYESINSLPPRYIRSKPIDTLREELNALNLKISK